LSRAGYTKDQIKTLIWKNLSVEQKNIINRPEFRLANKVGILNVLKGHPSIKQILDKGYIELFEILCINKLLKLQLGRYLSEQDAQLDIVKIILRYDDFAKSYYDAQFISTIPNSDIIDYMRS